MPSDRPSSSHRISYRFKLHGPFLAFSFNSFNGFEPNIPPTTIGRINVIKFHVVSKVTVVAIFDYLDTVCFFNLPLYHCDFLRRFKFSNYLRLYTDFINLSTHFCKLSLNNFRINGIIPLITSSLIRCIQIFHTNI